MTDWSSEIFSLLFCRASACSCWIKVTQHTVILLFSWCTFTHYISYPAHQMNIECFYSNIILYTWLLAYWCTPTLSSKIILNKDAGRVSGYISVMLCWLFSLSSLSSLCFVISHFGSFHVFSFIQSIIITLSLFFLNLFLLSLTFPLF